MSRTLHYHLDVGSHSVTVLTRHGASEVELLVDGKVVGYQRSQHRQDTFVLRAELPGEPPRPFEVTLHTDRSAERAAVCVLDMAGRSRPMTEVRPGRADTTPPPVSRPPLRSARRLLRSLVRHTHH
ncbi:hypothetical protein [Streptomyces flaveolus]|uniref:hypothetical protein n=1 Tax=Streptomyces flaveolus TaxID=67297 RepID=UPI0033F2D314